MVAGATEDDIAATNARVVARFGMRCRRLGEAGALWMGHEHASVELDGRGVVIGSLFLPGRKRMAADLGSEMCKHVADTLGDGLVRSCWGGYVAIISDHEGSRISVLRAPMGDLPCYIVSRGTMVAVASDVALLIASGAERPAVDWSAVARHLAAPHVRQPETCLAGVTELPGGHRLTIDGGAVIAAERWSPWESAAPERRIDDPTEARQRLRHAIEHSVAMLAADQPRIVLKLSGGLDSSIVAAALASAGGNFDCLNLVTDDATGDERRYAELAAYAAGRPLLERRRVVDDVALDRSAAWRLPRPTVRAFTQASALAVAEVATSAGATAVFDGGGGDNVFCSLQSIRPVIDCLLDERGRHASIATARSVATLAQVSVWTVVRRAWAGRRRWAKTYPWPDDHRLLTTSAIDASTRATAHPWFVAPDDALPGKAAHVALIAQAQSVVEGFDAEDALPTYSPLLAQPVVEACLKLPSWLWYDGPLNRAAARAAFADMLPPAITHRASKGSPDGFIADLYERNRLQIRSLLIGGELARHGLVDEPAILAMLDDPRPVVGHAHLRILQLVDVEAWARSWAGGEPI